MDKTFSFNGRFACRGDITLDYLPDFPGDVHVTDKSYRTRFGPCCYFPGVIYGNNNWNIVKALYRVLNVREPDRPGLDETLRVNQETFLLVDRFDQLRNIITSSMCVEYKHLFEQIIYVANKIHPKRKIRLASAEKLFSRGVVGSYFYVNYVDCKLKKEEWAKSGKLPRCIFDLSCPGSLLGSYLAEVAKYAMNRKPLQYSAGQCEFIMSPGQDDLTYAFKRLSNPLDCYCCFFSDDSCWNLYGLMLNVDISSCDVSHTPYLFRALESLFTGYMYEIIVAIVRQCLRPFKVVGPSGGFCIYRPLCEVMYSGWSFTTFLNNLAKICIFSAVMEDGVFTPDGVVNSAARCGYLVTVEVCPSYHHLQFLKCSPVMTNFGLRPLLNLGVILRFLGTCKGDLPGRKLSIEERGELFNGALVRCLCNGPSYPLVDALRSRFPRYCEAPIDIFHKDDYSKFSPSIVVSGEELIRYGVTTTEYNEIINIIISSRHGDLIRCPFTDKVLSRDYNFDFTTT